MARKKRQLGKHPIALSVKILKRFLSEKEFESLYDSYKSACLKRYRNRDITALDRKIWKEYREGATLSELGDSFGKSRNFILYSIALVARNGK